MRLENILKHNITGISVTDCRIYYKNDHGRVWK